MQGSASTVLMSLLPGPRNPGRKSAAIDVVSGEVGISVATLERWRADALANGSGERSGAGSQRWTAAARLHSRIRDAAGREQAG
jgi:transposase